jgi:hypothetical protein
MSTAYHPQTDGQTERANKTLEAMLRNYTDHYQYDWDEHLVMLEIAANNTPSATTGYTPYFLNYGQEINLPLDVAIKKDIKNKDVKALLIQLHEDLHRARLNAEEARLRQTEYANRSRREVKYKKGDKVMINNADLPVHRGTRKLAALFNGPFEVLEVTSPVNCRVRLPKDIYGSTTKTFHVGKLKPFVQTGQFVNRPAPRDQQEQRRPRGRRLWEIRQILEKRETDGKVEYLVDWQPTNGTNWEPEWVAQNQLTDAPMVREFEARQKGARRSRASKRGREKS